MALEWQCRVARRYSSVFSTWRGLERLQHVAHLDVLEPLEHDAALEPGLDLADVVLEAAQGADPPGPHDGPVADEAHLGAAGEAAVGDRAAGDRADPRGLEELQDLGLAERLLDLARASSMPSIAARSSSVTL